MIRSTIQIKCESCRKMLSLSGGALTNRFARVHDFGRMPELWFETQTDISILDLLDYSASARIPGGWLFRALVHTDPETGVPTVGDYCSSVCLDLAKDRFSGESKPFDLTEPAATYRRLSQDAKRRVSMISRLTPGSKNWIVESRKFMAECVVHMRTEEERQDYGETVLNLVKLIARRTARNDLGDNYRDEHPVTHLLEDVLARAVRVPLTSQFTGGGWLENWFNENREAGTNPDRNPITPDPSPMLLEPAEHSFDPGSKNLHPSLRGPSWRSLLAKAGFKR